MHTDKDKKQTQTACEDTAIINVADIEAARAEKKDREEFFKSFNDMQYDQESDRGKQKSTESEQLLKKAKAAYAPVDSEILNFIKNFVQNQNKTANQKHELKTYFFWFIMVLLGVIVVTPIATMVVLYFVRPGNSIAILAAVTASIVEVLAAIIVLPKIVAEYLFNKEEDVANVKIVELMKAYSETMHGYDKDSSE